MPQNPVTYNINALQPLNKPSDLLGKNMEVESLDGSQNYKVPMPLVIRTIAENLPASTKTTHIIARTWDTTDPNYIAGDETFLSIVAKQQLVHMMTARVEFPYPSREYRLVFDPRGGYLAYRDSTFTGGLNPVSWVEIDSEADVTKGVDDFNALAPRYAKGTTVKYNLDGSLRLFTAVKDLAQVNGHIAAPVAAGDTNWLEVNAATNTRIVDWLPGSYKKNDVVVYQGVVYRAKRDIILGDAEENPTDFYDYPKPTFWETLGGAGAAVNEWKVGAQKANSLVSFNGNLYRVKSDIVNGQSTPAGNAQYYQLITVTVDVNKAYVDAADQALQALIATKGDKTYVDAADQALQSQITTEKNRMDALVANAPQALDTLQEIANQLAQDEAGTAAILATQQQHTQQLSNLVLVSKPVTYNQLVQLINTRGLKPGNYYQLIDFQLTHTIPNTSATWTSAVEQLLLLATSTETLGAQGYSITYPSDIVYYTAINSNLMPGSTKGYIFKRVDTVQNNELEIDFRNVRFRRWLTTLPQPAYDGATELYIEFSDNGRTYLDLPIFEQYSAVHNNTWTGYAYARESIFTQLNITIQGEVPCRNNRLLNSAMLNVNVRNTFFYQLNHINSSFNNVNIIRSSFFTFLYGSMINSSISNRYVTSNESGYNLYSTKITNEKIAGKTLVAGIDMATLPNSKSAADILSPTTDRLDWKLYTQQGGSAIRTDDLDGTKIEIISNVNANNSVQFYSVAGRVQNNAHYTLSFDAKADSDCQFDIGSNAPATANPPYASLGLDTYITISTAFATYTTTFTTGNIIYGDRGYTLPSFLLGKLWGRTIWLKNVKLTLIS